MHTSALTPVISVPHTQQVAALFGADICLGVRSNSATLRAGSGGGSSRVGSGGSVTRVASASSAFTEAMLMRRAAGPAASGQTDSTLADVIARYSANIPPVESRPQQQEQQQRQSYQQQQQQQQQHLALPPVLDLHPTSTVAAASSVETASATIARALPAVRVSWTLPPPGPSVAAEPSSPSTIGGSWRERDARRSGDSSSSGEYPGRYIRSLPMLLSTCIEADSTLQLREALPDDPASTVSGYLDSIRRHTEGSVTPSVAAERLSEAFRTTASVWEEVKHDDDSLAASAADGGPGLSGSASSPTQLCALCLP